MGSLKHCASIGMHVSIAKYANYSACDVLARTSDHTYLYNRLQAAGCLGSEYVWRWGALLLTTKVDAKRDVTESACY